MPEVMDHSALDPLLSGLSEAPNWYVAYSGGVDSSALLHLVGNWRRVNRGAPPLTALHINHGLQEQSGEWENHCAWMCRFMDVPLRTLRARVEPEGLGLEAAAREARYALFEAQLAEGDVLFMGHHRDDQVETFFLRLLRGAGVEGLASMPGERPLGAGRLCRPLLEFSRSQLEAYVRRHSLQCVEDPSNRDIAMDRNFLRAEVMPLLASRWPGYRKTVARAGEHLAALARGVQASLEVPETMYTTLGDPGLPLGAFTEGGGETSARVLRAWLKDLGYPPPDQSALLEFLRQLRRGGANANPQLDTGRYRLQRYRDGVYLLPAATEPPLEPIAIAPGEQLDIPGVGRVALERAAGDGIWLAADEQLELRWRSGGERCRPVGRRRSVSLKKLLQAEAAPPWWRERIPLLYLAEELLAVGGLGPCQSGRWGAVGEEAEAPWKLSWMPSTSVGLD